MNKQLIKIGNRVINLGCIAEITFTDAEIDRQKHRDKIEVIRQRIARDEQRLNADPGNNFLQARKTSALITIENEEEKITKCESEVALFQQGSCVIRLYGAEADDCWDTLKQLALSTSGVEGHNGSPNDSAGKDGSR